MAPFRTEVPLPKQPWWVPTLLHLAAALRAGALKRILKLSRNIWEKAFFREVWLQRRSNLLLPGSVACAPVGATNLGLALCHTPHPHLRMPLSGSKPFRASKVFSSFFKSTLNWAWKCTGTQYMCQRTGIIWSNCPVPGNHPVILLWTK